MFEFLEGIDLHWVLLASVLVINALTQMTKKALALLNWNDTLEWFIAHLAPVVFGVALALVTSQGVDGGHIGDRILYFAAAGLASSWLYRLAKQFAKKKGYSLDSERPTEAPPA